MAKKLTANEFKAVAASRVDPGHYPSRTAEQLTDSTASGVGVYPDRRRGINRRGSPWRAFLYGNFHPRRRGSRRDEDSHHYLFDWHEPRILYLALGILLLSCTDALFTLNLINAGAAEANIIMAKMLEHSVDKFLAVKIVVTALSLLIMVIAARRQFVGAVSVEHLMQVFCGAYFLVICYEIYLSRFIFELDILPSA